MQSNIENEMPSRSKRTVGAGVASKGKGKAFDESPPTSPTAASPRSAARGLKGRTAARETFLDDITPLDTNLRNNEEERNGDSHHRDSHDLSLSPRQVTRDSLVDNMLLSLHQFSFGQGGAHHPSDDEMQLYASFAEEEGYESVQRGTPTRGPPTRGPRHQYSYSSDYDNGDDGSRYSSPYSRGHRSNSSSTFQQGLRRINSSRNDSVPGTASCGLQAAPGFMHSRNARGSRGSRGSSASSLDLGFTQGTTIKRWGNRRPSSFDQGQEPVRNFHLPNVAAPSFSPMEYEAAPTPTVPVGPRRIPPESPIQPPKGTHNTQHKMERKRSYSRTAPAAAKIFHGLHNQERELPALPAFIRDDAPSPVVEFGKRKETGGSSPQAKDKPGFFRRVFGGSSKTNVTSPTEPPSSQGSTASVETADRPRSKPPHIASQMKSRVSTPETPPRPVVTKKPSSFFRRRKRSESPTPTPAVPPLNLRSQQAEANHNLSPKAAEPSPVSSLRLVMNRYLNSPAFLGSPLSPSFVQHGTLDHEISKPVEEHVSSSLSAGYNVQKKTTIRSVPLSQEGSTENPTDRPKTRIPSEQARNEYGATFLRDSSDNDRDLPSFNSESPATRHVSGRGRLVIADSPPSATLARDVAFDENSPSETLYTTKPPAFPTMTNAPVHERTDTHEQRIAERDEDWVVFSKGKLTYDKEERIVLSPTSSEEDLAQDCTRNSDGTLRASGSTATGYKFTRSLPTVQVDDGVNAAPPPATFSLDSEASEKDSMIPTDEDRALAQQIYDGDEDLVQQAKAATWLGGEGAEKRRILAVYMALYDFADLNLLVALRMLCGRLLLRAESQQVDRILIAFADRWGKCNPNNGFKTTDVVHMICYSILLLNTDLHLADIEQKMTRSQFVKNTMSTIRQSVADSAADAFEMNRPTILPYKSQAFESEMLGPRSPTDNLPVFQGKLSGDTERPSWRSSFRPAPKLNGEGQQSNGPTPLDYETPTDDCGPLVKAPFHGTLRTWEVQMEIVLKDFYSSIRSECLPLSGATTGKPQARSSQNTLSVLTNGVLRKSPSVISKPPSEVPQDRARTADQAARLGTGKWSAKNRSRPRLYAGSTMSSSRTSLDDQSSMWSPSIASSTWTKYSLGKTQTSVSVDSYGASWAQGDYQQSIGFANALSQAIIREETIGSPGSEELRVAPLLDDESLELAGAPWAKEGILKHKHHLESLEKKAKDRHWNETFAVIEKGYMSLFSFTSKSIRKQAKGKSASVSSVVGGGNWQDNAESLGSFLLRQTIASALPAPGYSKTRPYVWALSLPTGAVHLFQVGTPDIVREFVNTANYWSARLSNHPLVGGISNIEYGFSDAIVNNSLVAAINESARPPSAPTHTRPPSAPTHNRRPSVQSSIRNSIDHSGVGVRARLPGDRITISDWTAPTQNMRASNLLERDQLNTLVAYVKGIEEELQNHNELRAPMLLAFTPRHPNAQKASANWEKKSSYLLREIVKFRTYIDSLNFAEVAKQRIYAERDAHKAVAESAEEGEDTRQPELVTN